MTKTGLEFRILVIVICLIFEICDLEFLFLQYFSTPKQLAIFKGSSIIPLPSLSIQVPERFPWRFLPQKC